MNRYFSCDTSEFTGVKPTLEIVDFYLEVSKVEKDLETVTGQITLEERRQSGSADCVVRELTELASTLLPQRPEGKRKAELENRLTIISNRKATGRSTKHHLEGLLALYTKIDTEALKQDTEALGVKPEDVKALQELKRKRTALEKRQNDLWAACEARCFDSGVPQSYLAAHADRNTAMRVVVNTFINTWRERSAWFEVPVTVYGVAIHSLPAHLMETWSRQYGKLGLDKQPKRLQFKFQEAPKTGPVTPSVDNRLLA